MDFDNPPSADLVDKINGLLARINLPPLACALPWLEVPSEPMIWHNHVLLWMIRPYETEEHGSVLVVIGPNGMELTHPLDAEVRVYWSTIVGDQHIALGDAHDIYVWRELGGPCPSFYFDDVDVLHIEGPCDCARANALVCFVGADSGIFVVGMDACECADDSKSLWRYRYLPHLPDRRHVAVLYGMLLWGGLPIDSGDERWRTYEVEYPVLAPTWSPERHHHHHAFVRALVLELLIIGRWAPRARMPPALWRLVLARAADRGSANLRDLVPRSAPADAAAPVKMLT